MRIIPTNKRQITTDLMQLGVPAELATYHAALCDYFPATTESELRGNDSLGSGTISVFQAITLTSNLTLNSGLHIARGGSLITNGFTLTINGPFSAGKYQVFTPSAAGQVVFGQRATNEILPEWFGAVADDSTNNAAAFAYTIGSVPANGSVSWGTGIYQGWVQNWRSNITLKFNQTTIKVPNGAEYTVINEAGDPVSGTPIALDIGETCKGNLAPAYTNVTVIGSLTIDGNRSNQANPPQDIFGIGMICTNVSRCRILADIYVKDCQVEGFATVINSNYARVMAVTVENCGDAIHGFPAFDINSSKYGLYNITSIGSLVGGRVLDNCWGNQVNITVNDADSIGFVINNQFVNEGCKDNIINVTVNGGCNVNAVQVGAKCYGNQINITTRNVEAGAVQVVEYAATPENESYGNTIKINSCGSQTYSLLANGGYDNNYDVVSVLDGRGGAQGTSYAVDIFGDRNTASIKVIDSATWQVRALRVNTGATNNVIPVITRTSTSSTITDNGTGTQIGITV